MKSGKSPPKIRRNKTLWESHTEAESRRPLVRWAWDFQNVPQDEIQPCYLYEYSRASPLIIAKIADNLKRGEIGGTVAKEELEPEIHFVVDFAEEGTFPKEHWLEIEWKRRRVHAVRGDRWPVGHFDPASMEAKQLLIYPLDSFLQLRRLFPIAGLSAKLPDHSGPHVFDVCWARSDRKLKKDFEQWLKHNRAKDQPGFQASAHGGSRRTTPRDLLKALGALRLMKGLRGNVIEARNHTLDSNDKPLYKDQAAWIKAAKKAEQHLIMFQRKMLRI